MRKVVNLLDKPAVFELLKQLHQTEVKDDVKDSDSKRESGAKSTGEVVELPPDIEELLL